MQNYYNYFSTPRYQKLPVVQKPTTSKFLCPVEALTVGNIHPNEYIPYKNYQPAVLNPTSEKEVKMFELMALGFEVTDLNLYLDMHPNDIDGLKLLSETIKMYDDKKLDYVAKYGPICLTMGDYEKAPFKWLSCWPWEGSSK